MNIDEYIEKVKEANRIANKEIKLLGKQFALSNSTVKVGDIIEDYCGKIKVEEIAIYYSIPPQCLYTGVEITKSGLPNKRGKKRGVCQTNLK